MEMDYDNRIAAVMQEISDLRKPMEKACERWLDVTAPWAAAFWNDRARAIVTTQPDVTQKMNPMQVHQLKEEVKTLGINAREFARETLASQSSVWPHLQKDLLGPVQERRSSPVPPQSPLRCKRRYGDGEVLDGPAMLSDQMLRYLGLIGPVLTQRGFRVDGLYWHRWSPEMAEAVEAYAQMHDRLLELQQELARLCREKAEGEAKSVWDAA
jgi:hypothetical protein